MDRLQKGKEFLKATQATLAAETKEMVTVSNRLHDNIVKAMRLMWRQLFFIWAGVIVLSFAYFFALHKTPAARQAGEISGTVARSLISSQIPPIRQALASPSISQEEEVRGILEQIREAQLKKDIQLFLKAYSPGFANLEKKKANLLRSWKNYDYLDLHFTVADIQKPNPRTIIAKVFWNITLEDLHSKQKSNLSQDYTVHFSQVSGKWLIQALARKEPEHEVAVSQVSHLELLGHQPLGF